MSFNTISLKKIAFIVFAYLLISQEPSFAEERLFFYKITKNEYYGYLFGIAHTPLDIKIPLRHEIEKALDNAPCLAIEMRPPTNEEQTTLAEKIRLKDGLSLNELISPPTSARLRKILEKYNYPPETLQSNSIWASANAIPFLIAQKTPAIDAENRSLESYLYERFKSANKEILWLETVTEQLSNVEQLTIPEQEALLVEALNIAESPASARRAMSHAFSVGNAKLLMKISHENTKKIPNFGSAINKYTSSRNSELSKKIDRVLSENKSCVFSTGALHLLGKDGIVSNLEVSGYDIKPQ